MDLIINRRHAELGVPGAASSCPAAIALKSAGFADAQVCTCPPEIRVLHDDGWKTYKLTKRLDAVIDAYDSPPHSFKIGVYRIPGLKRPKK